MNRAFHIFLFSVAVIQASADESAYLPSIKATHKRLSFLEAERRDWRYWRKPEPVLPAAQEQERLRLLGQLLTDDPVWTLAQQVQADIWALVALQPRSPADGTAIDALKELLAIIGGFEERATTRTQAEQFATTLRQFVARRDVTGAHTWAKSH